MEIVELNFSKFRKGGEDSEIRLQIQVDASASDSEEDVLLFVETNTPAVFMGLFRNEITGDLIGPTLWEVEIKFGTVPPPAWMQQVAQPDWSFSIDEETVHITNALAHVKSYAASGTAPDHKARDQRAAGRIGRRDRRWRAEPHVVRRRCIYPMLLSDRRT